MEKKAFTLTRACLGPKKKKTRFTLAGVRVLESYEFGILTYRLVRSFAYLDLILQDTPLDDPGVEEKLRGFVHEVDNLSDIDSIRTAKLNEVSAPEKSITRAEHTR